MTASEPWSEGDLIKNPNTRQFSTYDEATDAFVGTLTSLHFSQMYMVNSLKGNTVRIAGEILPEDSMHVIVRGEGQWSVMPCLFDQTTALTEALADYYQHASEGDLIKARNRFATFTEDQRWEGNLTALRPGEGYLFRRMGSGNVTIAFMRQSDSASDLTAKRSNRANGLTGEAGLYANPKAATNMTMIAVVKDLKDLKDLKVFIGDELAAIATPIDSLYFITIQSDHIGAPLRFEMNGETLTIVNNEQLDNQSSIVNRPIVNYEADAHYGSLKAPIVLRKDDDRPYKIIENNHVIIIRNNEKYNVTGKKL